MWNLCWSHLMSSGIIKSVLKVSETTIMLFTTIFFQIFIYFYSGGNLLFRDSVIFDYLQLYGLQHTRFPCPSPSPGGCSNSCPLSRWCHPTISSVVPSPAFNLSQTFPSIRCFLMNQFLALVTKVLELQHQPFQWIFSVDFIYSWLVWSPCSPRTFKGLQYHS